MSLQSRCSRPRKAERRALIRLAPPRRCGALTLSLAAAILAALPATSPASTGTGVPAPTAADPWPLVEHRGGAYAAFASDLPLFEQTGLTLDLTNHISDPSDGVVRYIDPRAVNLEWQYFGKYRCNFQPAACPVSQTDEQNFLTAFQAELDKQHDNPAVVGYYVIDDYLGNISGVLQKVHAMVQADTRTEAYPRPTICGFGGSVDYQDRNAPAGRYEKEYASLSHFSKLELQKFSPGACDMVDLYIYSLSHRAPVSDYSMAWTMPAMEAALAQHGWSSAATPLIGSPQAWGGGRRRRRLRSAVSPTRSAPMAPSTSSLSRGTTSPALVRRPSPSWPTARTCAPA
jgi:hypothetical protein